MIAELMKNIKIFILSKYMYPMEMGQNYAATWTKSSNTKLIMVNSEQKKCQSEMYSQFWNLVSFSKFNREVQSIIIRHAFWNEI